MPIHGGDSSDPIVEFHVDSEILGADIADGVITYRISDPGMPFGRRKPHITLILTDALLFRMFSDPAVLSFLRAADGGSQI